MGSPAACGATVGMEKAELAAPMGVFGCPGFSEVEASPSQSAGGNRKDVAWKGSCGFTQKTFRKGHKQLLLKILLTPDVVFGSLFRKNFCFISACSFCVQSNIHFAVSEGISDSATLIIRTDLRSGGG